MTKDFLDYLEDMVKAMNQAMNFVENLEYGDFVKDDKTTSAVLRKLEIVGEAAKKIPSKIKKEYSQIPWKEMAGMRDKLIHEYFGVNLKRVWKTIKEDLPMVKPLIEEVLRKTNKTRG